MGTNSRALAATAILTALLALTAGPSGAATVVESGEVGGQVWTAAGSPYTVNGEEGLTVPAGTELRVEAGVVVVFARGSGGIHVAGTLLVNGTSAAPIILQGVVDSPSTWGGIRASRCRANGNGCVPTNAAILRVRGAIIRNTTSGVYVEAPADVGVDATAFENCDVGLTLADIPGTGRRYLFDAVAARGCNVGISVHSASVTLTNALLLQNATKGVAGFAASLTILNSTFVANTVGVGSWQSAGVAMVDVDNSIFATNRQSIEVDAGPDGVATTKVGHSTFSFNDANLSIQTASESVELAGTVAPPGPGNDVADPRFQTTFDVHLREDSPCIDSGDPTRAPAHDLDGALRPRGAGIDRGAFEFGGGADRGAAGMASGAGGGPGSGNGSGGGAGGVAAPGGRTESAGGDAASGGRGIDGTGGFRVMASGGAEGVGDAGGEGASSGSGGAPPQTDGGGGPRAGGHGATSQSGGRGCQVGSPASGSSLHVLLMLVVAMVFGRRRPRRQVHTVPPPGSEPVV